VEPRSRDWLYPGRLAIRSISTIGVDSVALQIDGLHANESLRSIANPATAWRATIGPAGASFVLPLREGLTRYSLPRDEGGEERFVLEYVSSATQRRVGLSGPDALTLANSTLGRPGPTSEVSHWFAQSERLLEIPSALRVSRAADSEADLRALAAAYVRWSAGRHGTPSDRLIAASPATQLALIDRNEARGMCGVFSQTLLALARARGHRVRFVLFASGDEHATSHATLEVYWPSRRRWQLLDPTLGLWSAADEDGRYLAALDLHLLMASAPSAVNPIFDVIDPRTGVVTRQSWKALPDSLRDRIADWYGGHKQVIYYDADSFRYRNSLRDRVRRTVTAHYGVYRYDDLPSPAHRLLVILHRALAVGALLAVVVAATVAIRPSGPRSTSSS
jgi:hypothetical protein